LININEKARHIKPITKYKNANAIPIVGKPINISIVEHTVRIKQQKLKNIKPSGFNNLLFISLSPFPHSVVYNTHCPRV